MMDCRFKIKMVYLYYIMQVKGAYTTFEASRMLNAFVLFKEEGVNAMLETFPEYKDFVVGHKEWSVRQVKDVLFPSDISRVVKG
jgi:hypothetical protein